MRNEGGQTRRRLKVADTPSGQQSLALIADAFMRAEQPRLPKIAQLYNAIVGAIAEGQLEGGSKLPGERELSGALGVSLGTIQKSLHLLTRDGQITREHGRGSFVQSSRRSLNELWHFRFREIGGEDLLPVYARLADRRVTKEDGPWVREIGEDPDGYVRITRMIDVDGRFSCWSEMWLRASQFGRLLDLPKSALENVNLKGLLYEHFDSPTLKVRQTVRVAAAPAEQALAIGIGAAAPCLLLHVTALTRYSAPLSFQRIVAPQSDYEMELGVDPSPGPGDERPR